MQNVIIPQSLEQRVSWKTTLDAIVLTAGMVNTFTLQTTPVVTDATPTAIEASYYHFRIRRLLQEDSIVLTTADDVEIAPGSDKLTISIKLPDGIRRGYYLFQLILKDADKEPVANLTTYAVVNSAINPLTDNPYMSLDSVRAELGDISFADNKLLDSQEVGTWDICDAVKRAIEQWNNTAPRIQNYTGDSFPYPEILRSGAIYMLLQSLWTLLERNRMTYVAGSTQVDLERRADAYGKLCAEYRSRWCGGMNQAKNEENILQFHQSVGYL